MAIKITLIVLFIILILVFAGLAIWKWYQRAEDSDEHHLVAPIIFTALSLLSLIAVICIPGNIHQVNTGEVAVVRHMGKVTGTREAGIYWDNYFVNDYETYDTKIKEINIETQTYSKDNQIIGVSADLQYSIDSSNADKIATEYGSIDKLESKITSIALDNIKSVFAQNTATDVINNRSEISANISQTVENSLNNGYYVNLKTIVLTNIDFTDDFEAAVAAKVAAAQEAEKAKNEAEKAKTEAEAAKAVAILQAEAEAESSLAKANAAAEVARIKAEADQTVAKIEADTALYAGQKNAAIAIQKLAGINGWSVVTITEDSNNTPDYSLDDIITYKLVKYVGNDYVAVTADELAKGVEKLIEVYKYEAWDGALPTYQMGSNGTIAVVTP